MSKSPAEEHHAEIVDHTDPRSGSAREVGVAKDSGTIHMKTCTSCLHCHLVCCAKRLNGLFHHRSQARSGESAANQTQVLGNEDGVLKG